MTENIKSNMFYRYALIFFIFLFSGCIQNEVEPTTTIANIKDTLPVNLSISKSERAYNELDLSLCPDSGDFTDYDDYAGEIDCVTEALSMFNSVGECKTLPKIQKRLCIHHMAVIRNSPEICNSFRDSRHKDDCLRYIDDYN